MAAGRISDEDINRIREATDIVGLISERTQVKQKGRDFWACCPLHQEKTPSFKIDPSTQLWHCFGCGEGGDIFGFVMKADDLSFPEAVRKLAERAGIEIEETDTAGMPRSKKQRLQEACEVAAAFYHTQLMRLKNPEADKARSYLSGRNLGGDVPRKWELGFAPGRNALVRHLTQKGFMPEELTAANLAVTGRDGKLHDRFFNRVMFPIKSQSGDTIAFGGRIIGDGEPKYLNSQETPIFRKSQVLYGLDKAKTAMTATGCAIVTEGYTDVIAMHEAGIENAVATLGTALTASHLRILARHAGKKIVYIFDGDAAGQRATERALQFIDETVTPESGNRRIDVYALCLPDGQDPKEYLDNHSKEEMERLIDDAKPLIRFGIERRIAAHDTSTVEGRAKALSAALDVLSPIKESILAKDYAVQVASMLSFREEDVLDQLGKMPAKRQYAQVDESVSGQANMPASWSTSQGMSISEKNRLALERELLASCARNPIDVLKFAGRIEEISWHAPEHLRTAEAILGILSEKLDATPAEVVERASQAEPKAASILTASTSSEDENGSAGTEYVIGQLVAGDMEEKLRVLRSKLSRPDASKEEKDAVFSEIVELQNRLSDIKNSQLDR